MKQQFLQVWRDNQLWYEFPAENEDNVRLDLMKKDLDRVCEIRPAIADVQVLKEAVKSQVKEVNLNDTPKPKQQRQPTAEKAKTNDTSGIHPTTK